MRQSWHFQLMRDFRFQWPQPSSSCVKCPLFCAWENSLWYIIGNMCFNSPIINVGQWLLFHSTSLVSKVSSYIAALKILLLLLSIVSFPAFGCSNKRHCSVELEGLWPFKSTISHWWKCRDCPTSLCTRAWGPVAIESYSFSLVEMLRLSHFTLH